MSYGFLDIAMTPSVRAAQAKMGADHLWQDFKGHRQFDRFTDSEQSFIAAGAVVTKDVQPFALMAGVPAKQIGWMSHFGERMDLPLIGSGEWICDLTGFVYVLTDAGVEARGK